MASALDRVDQRGPDECWPWTGRCDPAGYGRLGPRLAHRVVFALVNGPIPAGLDVLHTCDNPPCCNPRHLYAGTDADNARDRDSRGRRQPPHGELNGRARLTAVQVAEIRARYAAGGVRQRDLAAEFGVGQAQVSAIIRGAAWAS